VGTQLLPSLSGSWLPNRSELAHLCHVLEKGADSLLLSTETTVGLQPMRTIAMIDALRSRYETRPNRLLFPKAA
jgi:pyruvate kinase